MKKFYDLILELQNENVGYLNLVQNGIFVQAIGKDAVLLRHIFSLKPVCFKKQVCKCVIPVSVVEKYIKKLAYEKYAFTVNRYDKETNKIIELSKVEGRKIEDEKVLWLLKEIIYSAQGNKGLQIRKLYITNTCKYLFK